MPAKERKLRFEEEDCPVKGLRLFNVTGYPPLMDEMFKWCRRNEIPVLDVQWWEGKAYAFYQEPEWSKLTADCIIGTMDVAFRVHETDTVVDGWSQSRFIVFK